MSDQPQEVHESQTEQVADMAEQARPSVFQRLRSFITRNEQKRLGRLFGLLLRAVVLFVVSFLIVLLLDLLGWLYLFQIPVIYPALPVLGVAVLSALTALALWKLPQRQIRAYKARYAETELSKLELKDRIQIEKELFAAENSARTTLAQIIGGLVLLSGLYFTWRNLVSTEEGKLTDRFSKAIELLGNHNSLDVRLGGIYALERIAADSQKDYWTVMEVLTAFVREHAPRQKTHPSEQKSEGKQGKKAPLQDGEIHFPDIELRKDIQAALTVIGRRKGSDPVESRLDLSQTDLRRARLPNASLRWADLTGADLRWANLGEAHLSGADLTGARLIGADLNEAYLSETNLNGADLSAAYLFRADLSLANLSEANLSEVDLSRARNLTKEQLRDVKRDNKTQLPPELDSKGNE